jgi:hypothetical protein
MRTFLATLIKGLFCVVLLGTLLDASSAILYADENAQQLKPAAPKLDTSKPEAPPSASAIKRNSSILQGKVEHLHTVKPHNFLGMPGHAKGEADTNIYRQNIQQRMYNTGITTGIGIIGVKFVLFGGHSPVINRVFPTTPAYTAGMQTDDVIVAVDGIPTRGLRKEEVYDMIVGTPGTPVTISIERDGDFKVYNLIRMNINELTDPAIRNDYLRSL